MDKRKYPAIENIEEIKNVKLMKNSEIEVVKNIKFRKEDWKILSLCNGEKTAEEVVKESKIEEEKAWQSLHYLLHTGFLFKVEESLKIIEIKKKLLDKFMEGFASPLCTKEFWVEKVNEIVEKEIPILKQVLNNKKILSPSTLNRIFSIFFEKLYSIAEEYFGYALAKIKMEKVINV